MNSEVLLRKVEREEFKATLVLPDVVTKLAEVHGA